jgi:pimeloyl-ACP methyl ester carboxylesterase
MPKIKTNDIMTYYEIHGEGNPLIFIHGGLVTSTMWQPQVDYFSRNFKVITYDVRGHGKTGVSPLRKYSVELFADDLEKLLEKLKIEKPIICGLSLGGMIAQAYATKYPQDLRALILSDTAISTSLTYWDKLMVYILFPKWMMLPTLRMMGVKNFIKFSFWIAKFTRGKEWIGKNEIEDYEKNEMLKMDKKEYLKVFGAIYDFKLQELSKIKVPVLIINGEFESKSVFKHSEKMKELIDNSSTAVIPKAGHTSNLENPEEFNRTLEEFLEGIKL